MLDSAAFLKRLEHILEYYTITASAFADKIDVQRSAISHIMSGRNKPSLEFVLKIADSYPEINIEWLLGRKNSFLYTDEAKDTNHTFTVNSENKVAGNTISIKKETEHYKSEEPPGPTLFKQATHEVSDTENNIEIDNKEPLSDNSKDDKPNNDNGSIKEEKNITAEKIVIFYSNGTFKEYKPG